MALLRAIGLMSGTSMDGIDIACVETDGDARVTRGPSGFVPYEAAFRRRIEASLETAKAIEQREDRPGGLAALESEITRRHALAVSAFLKDNGWTAGDIAVIGFHGQTVLHRPEKALTVQLGDGAALARETGVPVVFDMRANDMRHGGQGAPLVPAYHAALARTLAPGRVEFPVMAVNVGGISNVTWVPETGTPVAFDSGPGNALIDQWVQAVAGIPYDDGGRIASEGVVIAAALARYMDNPYFARDGAKSLDRNDFTLDPLGKAELADGARTLAAVTAHAIARAADHVPERSRTWVLCGGGRKNGLIGRELETLVEPAHVLIAEDLGWNGDSMEAEAWAYLAVRALNGLPLTWPTTTGCREPVTGGVLARPGG
ncbi:MAG: anhydro-N-acetylmuramic acid kinase [Phyllobacteriaceae bacterium]|nr:anhydro-N-acetylmuramic acid kinase [Phyllobacteriaceae bacterium]MBA89529.1 anhydro-N-acetylmuramic acid kinase [Phyllobacteriaceae bacterium]